MAEPPSSAISFVGTYLPLVLMAAFVLVGSAIWFSVPRPNPRRLNCEPLDLERLATRARELGWEFSKSHPAGSAYALAGKLPNGAQWKLHYDYTPSFNSRTTTYRLEWMTESVRAARTELLVAGKKIFRDRTSLPMRISMRITAAIGRTLNKGNKEAGPSIAWINDLSEFISKARDLGLGSTQFRERFVVAAPPDVKPHLQIDGELERLICDWPEVGGAPLDADQRFAAWLETVGLRIELYIQDPPLPIIEHLARIGPALAARIR